ncbi:MAG TPA: alpha-xylosidase, partial [Mariniflexile sp.]
ELASFNSETGKGTIKYVRYNLATRQAFNNMLSKLVPAEANEFPTTEYAVSPELPFSIEFISDRTIRIKTTEARGKIYLPNNSELHELVLESKGSSFILKNNPVDQKTKFKIN